MTCAVLAFAVGVLLLQHQAALPSLAWAFLLVPAAALAHWRWTVGWRALGVRDQRAIAAEGWRSFSRKG